MADRLAAFPQLRQSLPEGKSRSVLLGFWLDEGDRAALLASLRGALPVDIVADVRVNGRGWEDP